ncbi:MAG: V-type ATPase subunit [Ruminococcus sp.]|nr:V-type ATPase subunit [Ruminococcus sp.]
MSTTKYANAVAAIKAMENFLLTRNDLEQLISASTAEEMESLISARRGSGSEELTLEGVWEMIRGYAPDSDELKVLLYKNDFHNLKAVLKSMLSGRELLASCIRPTNLDLDELAKALSTKEFELLPDYIGPVAEQAYELITRTLDGQLADSLIDCACMKAMLRSAEESGSEFMIRYAKLITQCADIKTAYRCGAMQKQRSFLETAVCGSPELDRESLIRAALGGPESVLAYLETTSYSDAGKLLGESAAAFEKWCDDQVIELAESARFQAFGAEPLAAYYLAAEAELKNLRIIRVCRGSGADRETITERMRRLYV